MNAIDHAIRRIEFTIPREILEKTFKTQKNRFRSISSPTSVASGIREEVIKQHVIADCNVYGGQLIPDIPINRSWCEIIDSSRFIVRVPKYCTQNRKITQITSATYVPHASGMLPYANMQAVSDLHVAKSKLLNSSRLPLISGTAMTEIVGDNTIEVQGALTIPFNLTLSVLVEYDEHMSSLSVAAYNVFAKLCTLAVQNYIWVNRIVMMDKAEVEGGFTLNRFSSIIEGYEDSGEQYLELLEEKWKKVSFMGDPKRAQKHLAAITRIGL